VDGHVDWVRVWRVSAGNEEGLVRYLA
jgi:hypothetical protein